MASLLLLLLGTPLTQSPAGPPMETRIDRVISVVGEAIVTASDLRIEQDLLRFDAISCPPLAAPQTDVLGLLEERRILHRLAEGRTLYAPTKLEISNRIKLLTEAMGPEFNDFQNRWGLRTVQLETLMRDRIMEESYVDANLGRALQAEQLSDPSEREIRYRQAYRSWINARKEGVSIRRPQDRTP
jgi:hypothetical protein